MIVRSVVIILLSLTTAHAQSILSQEPPMGALREGQTVYVDDGSCPKGQIKVVTGGNHVRAGGTGTIIRGRGCVSRRR